MYIETDIEHLSCSNYLHSQFSFFHISLLMLNLHVEEIIIMIFLLEKLINSYICYNFFGIRKQHGNITNILEVYTSFVFHKDFLFLEAVLFLVFTGLNLCCINVGTHSLTLKVSS